MTSSSNLKPVFLFIVTSYSYFLSHRIPAFEAAKLCGFKVHLICEKDVKQRKIPDLTIHNFNWNRNDINPIKLFGVII